MLSCHNCNGVSLTFNMTCKFTEYSLKSINIKDDDVRDQLVLLQSTKPAGPDNFELKLIKVL